MATKSSEYMLLVITATGCPACVNFKQAWPEMKKQLQKIIPIVEINQPQVTNELDITKVPTNLYKYVSWFPTMVIVRADEFKPGKQLTYGSVFNGEITPAGVAKISLHKKSLNLYEVQNWVNSIIA